MQAQQKHQVSDLSLDGLEGLLDPAEPAQSPGHSDSTADSGATRTGAARTGNAPDQEWTLEETARALGLSRGAVIRRIEDGILSGYRVKRGAGWVWRVKPTWLNRTAAHSASNTAASTSTDASTTTNMVFSCNRTGEETPAAEPDGFKSCDTREWVEVFDVCEESAGLPALPAASFRDLIVLKTKLEMAEFQYQDACQKLESASYKIGYLEARLEASQEQLRMLTDSRAKQSWWKRWRQWFSATRTTE